MNSSIKFALAFIAFFAAAASAARAEDDVYPIKDVPTPGDVCMTPAKGEWSYCGPEGTVAYKVAISEPTIAPHPIEQPNYYPPGVNPDDPRPYNNSGQVGTAVPATVGSAVLNVGSSNPITLEAAPPGYHWACQEERWSGKCVNAWLEKDTTWLGAIIGLGLGVGGYLLECNRRNSYYNPHCRGY